MIAPKGMNNAGHGGTVLPCKPCKQAGREKFLPKLFHQWPMLENLAKRVIIVR